MTKAKAVEVFKNEILPQIKELEKKYTAKDSCMRSLEWSYFTDSLCKNGDITESQYNRWTVPSICE